MNNFDICLVRASLSDAEKIWSMQKEAFTELFEKYQDFETSPATEPLERTVLKLKQSETYFYMIQFDGQTVGAVRVVDSRNNNRKRISPMFILSGFRNIGIAQKAIKTIEEIHGSKNWELATIMQEKGNCHLYEKMGYRTTGETKIINDKLTLVFYQK